MKKGHKLSRQERIGIALLRYAHSLGAFEGQTIGQEEMERSARALEDDLESDGLIVSVGFDGVIDLARPGVLDPVTVPPEEPKAETV